MASKYSKLGYGNYENIDSAVEAGTLNSKDIVITKDTSELIYIKDDNSKQKIKSRVSTYDSEDDAITQLNEQADTYAGQPVAIKNNVGEYEAYVVQQGEEGFMVSPVAGSGFVWQEF